MPRTRVNQTVEQQAKWYGARHILVSYKEGDAAACPPLRSNPPSKMAVKTQVLCKQAARVSRQTTQHTIYSKATKKC